MSYLTQFRRKGGFRVVVSTVSRPRSCITFKLQRLSLQNFIFSFAQTLSNDFYPAKWYPRPKFHNFIRDRQAPFRWLSGSWPIRGPPLFSAWRVWALLTSCAFFQIYVLFCIPSPTQSNLPSINLMRSLSYSISSVWMAVCTVWAWQITYASGT